MRLIRLKNVSRGNIDFEDINEKKKYKRKQIGVILGLYFIIALVYASIYCNNPISYDAISRPLTYYLEYDATERSMANVILNGDACLWVLVSIFAVGVVFYLSKMELRFRKVKEACPQESCGLRKLLIPAYRALTWLLVLVAVLTLNVVFYRKDILLYFKNKNMESQSLVAAPPIEHKGPDLKKPNNPPYELKPHSTVSDIAKENGMSVEKLQLYALMWTIYRNDEPIATKFPDPKMRFFELEKHHYHIVCKDEMSCLRFINTVAPINRSLITLKISIFHEAQSLGVEDKYFNKDVEKLNTEPLVKMRDAVQIWANEIERSSTDPETVEIPKILYYLNIEPSEENLRLFEEYIRTLDSIPLNPKLSVGFLDRAIDTDPELRLPIPRVQNTKKQM